MNIAISPHTQKLIEAQMHKGGYQDPDALVRHALETLEQVEGPDLEELAPDTQSSIVRGEAQADRGEKRPWQDVKAEIGIRKSW